MVLLFKNAYYLMVCAILYLYYTIAWYVIYPSNNEKMFLSKYLSISIRKKILGINNIKLCEKLFKENIIRVMVTNRLIASYAKLCYPLVFESITSEDNNVPQNKGVVYLTFHFAGNIEGIVYYLSRKYNECYFIYNKDSVEAGLRKRLGVENINELKNIKYYNNNFKFNYINYTDKFVLLKIKRVLNEKKPLVILFDQFGHDIKKILEEQKCVKYKIDNKIAAIVPKALFDIVAITNSSIIPIINLRKGFINNNLIISKPLLYNNNENPSIEYERMLKEIYDTLLGWIRINPLQLEERSWCLFREYVKDDALIKEIDNEFRETDSYKPTERDVKFYRNKKENHWLLLKINKFKVIKVDELTVNIFKYIQKNNSLPISFLHKREKENIKARIEYLLNTNFIVKA